MIPIFHIMNKKLKSTVIILLAVLLTPAYAQSLVSSRRGPDDPAQCFLHPPESAKPGVLWMWMGSNLSKVEITRDLEALKKQGVNRTTMFSLADVTTPWAGEIRNSPTPEIISWTEPWWRLVRFAAQESKRLHMDFGMYNGAGYEASGGTWITPENSMQELCWSRTHVSGNTKISIKVGRPVVALRGHTPWPVYNPGTGLIEIPEIASRATYYKDIAVLALRASGTVRADQVVNLTGKMSPDGSLVWDVPPGDWDIYRFGHTTSGTLIQPAQWKATGLECDKMSQEAVDFHLDHELREIKKHLGDLIGTGFTHLHFDSYEAGTPTWTPKMREEFLQRRGYDLTPYLPVFAGRLIGENNADSLKIAKDFEATVKDLYRDIYFKTIAKKLAEARLDFLCEPYGGPWRQDEIMPYVKRVMTEFWTHNGNYSPVELDPTVAALRRSGQNIVEAEAFTGDPRDSKWDETPAWLKPIGDASFCAGVNRLVLHRFVEQPWDDKYKPGATMGQWGTHFDRTQTWWKPAKAMVTYWQRCQALLQWGRISADKEDFFAVDSATTVIRHIHRAAGPTDIYFVANISRSPVSATCRFKVSGMQPELWDPVTGAMQELPDFVDDSRYTSILVKFQQAQSFFFVFRKKIIAKQIARKRNFPETPEVTAISGPWRVKFDEAWGGPASPVTFRQLEDWTKRPETGIKYYSGTATYMNSFDLTVQRSGPTKNRYLDLGAVNHIAQVKLNGVSLGTVWTAPWRIKIPTGLLKSGKNTLVIEVTNVWANRLIGDEQEPADCQWLPGEYLGSYLKEFPDWFLKHQPRPSSHRYCFTTWNYFTKDSPLIPSGLLGPVCITGE